MASEKYLGGQISTAVKLPCTAPAVNDVFVINPSNPLVGQWQKAATANLADLSVTEPKIGNDAVVSRTIAALAIRPVHLDRNAAWGVLVPNGDFGVFNGGAVAPPDGWDLGTDTVWDVDVSRIPSILQGIYAVRFSAGAATRLMLAHESPVQEAASYKWTAKWRASVAGDFGVIAISWFNAAKVLVDRTIVHNGVSAGAGVYTVSTGFTTAPANARFGKINVGKGGVTTGTVDFDVATLAPAGEASIDCAFSVHKGGTNQTGIVGPALVTWATELYDYDSNFAPSTELFTAPTAGVYLIGAKLQVASMADQNIAVVYLGKNGSTSVAELDRSTQSGVQIMSCGGVVELLLAAGDTIGVYADGNIATVNGGATASYFFGRLISGTAIDEARVTALAEAAIAAHVAESDPHPQYVLKNEHVELWSTENPFFQPVEFISTSHPWGL